MYNSELKPIIGVSSCLMGHAVRFDGGHKLNQIVTGMLNNYFEYRPFCPELEAGMAVPRQPIRLVKRAGSIHVIGVRNPNIDMTQPLRDVSQKFCHNVMDSLCGYIVKKGSPSCGMERVKLYNDDGVPVATTQGIFTELLTHNNPLLPVEEEGRLTNTQILNNFLVRVFVYHDWKCLVEKGQLTKSDLIEFHTNHKYLLLSHNEESYRLLGKLLAETDKKSIASIKDEYIAMLMKGLSHLPTRLTHSNVLYHIVGFFKRALSKHDKQELIRLIEDYRLGKHAIIAPVTLLLHYLRLNHSSFLARQSYLDYQKKLAQF